MTNDTTTRKPLRLWPGVVLAIAIVLLYIAAPIAFPEAELPVGMFGALARRDPDSCLVAALQPRAMGRALRCGGVDGHRDADCQAAWPTRRFRAPVRG